MADGKWSSPADVAAWRDVIAFEPSGGLIGELDDRGFLPRPLTTGEGGDVNLDDFAVRVSRLPLQDGQRLTPEQLLAHVRTNLNAFVDPRLAEFQPEDEDRDGPRWCSAEPAGAIVIAHLKMLGLADAAPLVCSGAAADHWRFTTLARAGRGAETSWRVGARVPVSRRVQSVVRKAQAMIMLRGSHPISGTREFGVRRGDDDTVELYTRAADCVTDTGWQILVSAAAVTRPDGGSIIYAMGEKLWRSFQERTVAFVNTHEGTAAVMPPRVLRPSYGAIAPFAPA